VQTATLHPARRGLSYGIASPRRGGALLVPRPRSAATFASSVNLDHHWGAGTASAFGRPDAPDEGNLEEAFMKFARVAAAITAVVIVLGVVTFLVWPPLATASVADWFARFQASWLHGMLDLDLLMLVSNIAAIPIWVAGYLALRRTSPSLMALAAPLGLVAAATYFSSSRLFEMVALSSQYAAATTDATRMASLALDWSTGSVKASSVMNSATVKPIPAAAPTPTIWRGSAPSGYSANPARTVTRVANTTPSGLPTSNPKNTPQVIGDRTASPSPSAEIEIPLFANAKIGTIT
jgi:hypothetical protein